MFRSVTPLFVLAPHDSNVAFACKSLYRSACCICLCFNLALFLQDDGFHPPYRSNPLPIAKFSVCLHRDFYTQRGSLMRHSTHERSQKNATHCEDQLGLVKLAWVTLPKIQRFWHLTFQHKRRFLFSSGRKEVFKRMLTGSPALSFSLPDPTHCWSRLSPTPFFDRPHWPRAWNRLPSI